MNEAETCRTMVRPRLEAAGWLANGERFFREQMHITHGRIVLAGGKPKRQKRKIPDFLLYFTRDILLAVVEAKSDQRPADVGLQQAKEYAQLLGLKFAYATNGTTIIEHDAITQTESQLAAFPSPAELWQRYLIGMGLSSAVSDAALVPDFFVEKKQPRYYQRIAIDTAVRAIVGGRKRCLLPIPPYETQLRFDALQAKADALRALQSETAAELDAVLPSVLNRAFAGEL